MDDAVEGVTKDAGAVPVQTALRESWQMVRLMRCYFLLYM